MAPDAEQDFVLEPDLSPRDPRAITQVVAGIETLLTFLARGPDILDDPVAKRASEVMVMLAVNATDTKLFAPYIDRIYKAAFEKKMLYWLVLERVTAAVKVFEITKNRAKRDAAIEKLRLGLGSIETSFAGVDDTRLEFHLRSSAIEATGAGRHGPAYTAAAIALDAGAFGLTRRSRESTAKAVERIAKLFRESARALRGRTHKR